jgi:hypothetical protein
MQQSSKDTPYAFSVGSRVGGDLVFGDVGTWEVSAIAERESSLCCLRSSVTIEWRTAPTAAESMSEAHESFWRILSFSSKGRSRHWTLRRTKSLLCGSSSISHYVASSGCWLVASAICWVEANSKIKSLNSCHSHRMFCTLGARPVVPRLRKSP